MATKSQTTRVATAHDTYVDVYRQTLDADEQALFDGIRTDGNPTDVTTIREGATPGSVASDPNAVRGAADNVVGQIAYLAALEDYSNGFHERVATEVRVAAERMPRRRPTGLRSCSG